MDLLHIDFKSLLPNVINAFTYVYGEKYRDIITEKLNKAVILYYYNFSGLRAYILKTKNMEASKITVEFLEEIGLDINKYGKINYYQPLGYSLNMDDKHVLSELLVNPGFFVSGQAPLQAFGKNYNGSHANRRYDQAKVINLFLEKDGDHIEEEDLVEFSKTDKYKDILNIINHYNEIVERLLAKYNKNIKDLLNTEEYLKQEEIRENEIKQEFTYKFSNNVILRYLPESVKAIISHKCPEELVDFLLPDGGLVEESVFEFFSKEKMKKLKDPNEGFIIKNKIVNEQLAYLKKLGIVSNDVGSYDYRWEKWLAFLEEIEIEKYLPNEEEIQGIKNNRERCEREARKAYFYSREDSKNMTQAMIDSKVEAPDVLHAFIWNSIQKKEIHITGKGDYTTDNEYVSVMLYNIRKAGSLLCVFMHECSHIIEQNEEPDNEARCGFEPADSYRKSPYMNQSGEQYRRYERFNEIMSDIFNRRAIRYLWSKGIFLMEPEEFTNFDINNHNTTAIDEEALGPLFEKFEDIIKDIKVNAHPELLIQRIGEENYENLIDTINTIDYLSSNNDLGKRYINEQMKLDRIYSEIDEYYANNYNSQGNLISV